MVPVFDVATQRVWCMLRAVRGSANARATARAIGRVPPHVLSRALEPPCSSSDGLHGKSGRAAALLKDEKWVTVRLGHSPQLKQMYQPCFVYFCRTEQPVHEFTRDGTAHVQYWRLTRVDFHTRTQLTLLWLNLLLVRHVDSSLEIAVSKRPSSAAIFPMSCTQKACSTSHKCSSSCRCSQYDLKRKNLRRTLHTDVIDMITSLAARAVYLFGLRGMGDEYGRGRVKRKILEKTRRPTASSGTIPTCENPAIRPGFEPGSPCALLGQRKEKNNAGKPQAGTLTAPRHAAVMHKTVKGDDLPIRVGSTQPSCQLGTLPLTDCQDLAILYEIESSRVRSRSWASPWPSSTLNPPRGHGASLRGRATFANVVASAYDTRPKWPRQPPGNLSPRVSGQDQSQEPTRVKRGEYGTAPECKGGGNGRSPRKPTDQRHRPARCSRAKIQERPQPRYTLKTSMLRVLCTYPRVQGQQARKRYGRH
ncbi:hypothetical protein PR048_016956 [Dryococelus australis]|uniref:Uncharacterized protein n=1 Tax=Dryococelus australis TaxID=614101 RepID=A0ABQ9H864_9NEOP|nr:hypothetical protein PR048_016956 [Dryococelus australis]